MKPIALNAGRGRTKVSLSAQWIGTDLIVCLFNGQGHLGAVAVADFCHAENKSKPNSLDFVSDDKTEKLAARVMLKMTNNIN